MLQPVSLCVPVPSYPSDRVHRPLAVRTVAVAGASARWFLEQFPCDDRDLLAVLEDRGMRHAQFPRGLTHAESMSQQEENLLLHVAQLPHDQVDEILRDHLAEIGRASCR